VGSPSSAANGAVSVETSGRLHLGFLDPSATLGRRFGSIGMMIDDAITTVRLAFAEVPRIGAAPQALHELERTGKIITRLQRATGRLESLDVQVSDALPAHKGLGSGTQLAMALGRAFADLHGLQLSTAAIARLLTRGNRSGIGIAGFDLGGFLVDGGSSREGAAASDVPPLLARFDFPGDWRMVLVQDSANSGLHGEGERAGLACLPEFPRHHAAHLCHLVLMQILPGLAARDFVLFARGLTELQGVVGEYFAPVQGGVFSSPRVGTLMGWIGEHHVAAVGQSSWGPTSFAILPSHEQALHVLSSAKSAGMIDAGLDVKIVAGKNRGAVVSHEAGFDRIDD
jgi:beta-RFAP synthase